MNDYQFHMIVRTMEQRYGKIKKGEEEQFTMLMFPMEGNLLKVHRRYPSSNSRRLLEAILLTLHEVEHHINPESSSAAQFENEDNARLKEALLAAFDPLSNEEIMTSLPNGFDDIADKEKLLEFYRVPVKCLMRIRESVEHWIQRKGSNGYFEFIEELIGPNVPFDEKMNFAVIV